MGFPTHFVEENKLEKWAFVTLLVHGTKQVRLVPTQFSFVTGSFNMLCAREHDTTVVREFKTSRSQATIQLSPLMSVPTSLMPSWSQRTRILFSDELAAKHDEPSKPNHCLGTASIKTSRDLSHSFDHGYQYALGTKDNRLTSEGGETTP